ncbi:MAG: hypothetical protein ACE5FT_06755 [Candidatus Nanoarchaeia archaeon]
MAKQELYVGIDDSTKVRKDLLLSSKDLLHSLKSYEQLKSIRAQKMELMYKYRRVLEEVFLLNKKLKKKLPKSPKKPAVVLKKPVEAPKRPSSPVPARKDLDTVKQLEQELDAIESKLNSLDKL